MPALDIFMKRGFNLFGMNDLLQQAVAIVGSQVRLAAHLGVTVQAVNQVVNGIRPLPARWAIPIEEATGGAITRYQMLPRVFGHGPEGTELD